MLAPLTLKEFYAGTLKAAGFTPPEDSTAKFAEAAKVDVETLKTAQAVFEQLQLDGVSYDTPKAMADDAMKIATAYLDHCKEAATEAEKLANDLLRVTKHAVEGYLAQGGIDLDALEGVKIAGLQAQSFQQLTQKQADLRQLETKAEDKTKTAVSAQKTAQDGDPLSDIANAMPGKSHKDKMKEERGKTAASFAAYHVDAGGNPVAANDEGTIANVAAHAKLNPEVTKQQIHNAVGPENVEAYGQHYGAAVHANPNMPFSVLHPQVVQAVKANGAGGAGAAGAAAGAASGAKPFLQRPGVMLGAGALGLGAAMLLHRKRQEAQAAQNRQNAIAGAANLPPAA